MVDLFPIGFEWNSATCRDEMSWKDYVVSVLFWRVHAQTTRDGIQQGFIDRGPPCWWWTIGDGDEEICGRMIATGKGRSQGTMTIRPPTVETAADVVGRDEWISMPCSLKERMCSLCKKQVNNLWGRLNLVQGSLDPRPELKTQPQINNFPSSLVLTTLLIYIKTQ